MPLYTYSKNNPNDVKKQSESMIIEYYESKSEKITIFKIFSGIFQSIQYLVNTSNLANFLVPGIFIILGSVFIYKQFFPDIQQAIEQNAGFLAQGSITPVSDEYINFKEYISNPAGLSEVSSIAFSENILADDIQSKSYRGIFYISIPSLGINRMPITANVDSTTEESYMSVLDTTLAHFQNTGLPISDIQNNIVIYGHSASQNYGPRVDDPMVAFSFLPDLKVGDDIVLEIEGKTFNYKMQRSKIVDPNDTSVITGTKGKRTLTLFTCYPAGNNAKRYIAIARPV